VHFHSSAPHLFSEIVLMGSGGPEASIDTSPDENTRRV